MMFYKVLLEYVLFTNLTLIWAQLHCQ